MIYRLIMDHDKVKFIVAQLLVSLNLAYELARTTNMVRDPNLDLQPLPLCEQ